MQRDSGCMFRAPRHPFSPGALQICAVLYWCFHRCLWICSLCWFCRGCLWNRLWWRISISSSSCCARSQGSELASLPPTCSLPLLARPDPGVFAGNRILRTIGAALAVSRSDLLQRLGAAWGQNMNDSFEVCQKTGLSSVNSHSLLVRLPRRSDTHHFQPACTRSYPLHPPAATTPQTLRWQPRPRSPPWRRCSWQPLAHAWPPRHASTPRISERASSTAAAIWSSWRTHPVACCYCCFACSIGTSNSLFDFLAAAAHTCSTFCYSVLILADFHTFEDYVKFWVSPTTCLYWTSPDVRSHAELHSFENQSGVWVSAAGVSNWGYSRLILGLVSEVRHSISKFEFLFLSNLAATSTHYDFGTCSPNYSHLVMNAYFLVLDHFPWPHPDHFSARRRACPPTCGSWLAAAACHSSVSAHTQGPACRLYSDSAHSMNFATNSSYF